jgi:hypothetical protein
MAPKQQQKATKIIEQDDDEEEPEEIDEDEEDNNEDAEEDEEEDYNDYEEEKDQSSEYETDDNIDIDKEKLSDTNIQSTHYNSIIITGKDRISSNIMSSYEFNRICSVRINQIRLGAKPMLRNIPLDTPPEEIVIKELKNKTLPFVLFRHTPHGNEEWNISELYIDHLL